MPTFFVPGRITNPLNGSHRHWSVRARWAKEWRGLTATIAHLQCGGAPPTLPKRIRLVGHVARRFDDDNYRAAMKPVRDGLRDGGIIQNDDPSCGHLFEYDQVVKRPFGVTVIIENFNAT